jgi:ketosteroid isomerase-like protein
MSERTYTEVAEGVRAALATYTQALDDGRVDDVVATFCPDGAIELPGMGSHTGHDALRQAYTKWAPRRPQRHLVLNTVIGAWNDDEATAVSDVIFILLGEEGWDIKLVGRYSDVLRRDGTSWRFHHRAATFITEQPEKKTA